MSVSGLRIPPNKVSSIQSHILAMFNSESLKQTLRPILCQYLCEAIEEISDNTRNSCPALLALALAISRGASDAIFRAVAGLAFMAALHSFKAGPEDTKATKVGLALLETLDTLESTEGSNEGGAWTSTKKSDQNFAHFFPRNRINPAVANAEVILVVKYFVARMICKCTWPRDKYEALKARRVEVAAARKLAVTNPDVRENGAWLTDSLISLGELLTSWGYEALLEESVPIYEELVSIARSSGDVDLLRLSLSRLAANDEPQRALSFLDDLIALNSSLEDAKVRKEALFKAYAQKGRICSNLKMWRETEHLLQIALADAVDISEKDRLEIMSRILESLFYQDKFDSARRILQEQIGSAAPSAEIETRIRILGIVIHFAYLDLLESNPPRIVELCFERLKLAEKARDFRAEAECCDILATVTLLLQREYARSVFNFYCASPFSHTRFTPFLMCSLGESEIYMSRCMTVFNRLHDPISIAKAHMRRAAVMLKYLAPRDRSFAAESLALYESALRIVRNAELDLQEKCYFEIARCFEALQKYARARQFFERARKMRLRANDHSGAQTIMSIIRALPQQEDVDDSDEDEAVEQQEDL